MYSCFGLVWPHQHDTQLSSWFPNDQYQGDAKLLGLWNLIVFFFFFYFRRRKDLEDRRFEPLVLYIVFLGSNLDGTAEMSFSAAGDINRGSRGSKITSSSGLIKMRAFHCSLSI